MRAAPWRTEQSSEHGCSLGPSCAAPPSGPVRLSAREVRGVMILIVLDTRRAGVAWSQLFSFEESWTEFSYGQ